MQNDKYYLAFSFLLNVSPLFKAGLLEYFNYDVEHAFRVEKHELKNFEGSVPYNFFSSRDRINPDNCLSEVKNRGLKYITLEDSRYPNILKQIPDYPLLLYYRGEFERCYFDRTLAIVGSRRATEGAKGALSKIIHTMQNLPITIVSGLAMGIDAVAHREAINNNIPTIGVIGCGIDITYPYINKDLYKKMEDSAGLILSEYPPMTVPIPRNFPQRNRIVTGLSYGTLVAEAALRSGALISANLALEQGRDVMCLPGVITNPNTEGIYKLVHEGAPLVTSSYDIFEILGWDFESLEDKIELSEHEKILFDIIRMEAVGFEKIQSMSGLDSSEIMITLTGLELKGFIKQKNGLYMV